MNKITNIITSALIAVSAAIPLLANAERPTEQMYGFQKLDLNYDGYIDAVDASIILSEYANVSVGNSYNLPVTKRFLADFDNNLKIDAVDASSALKAYAYNSSHSDKYEERFLAFNVNYTTDKGMVGLGTQIMTYEECLEIIDEHKEKLKNKEIPYVSVKEYTINRTVTTKDGIETGGIYFEKIGGAKAGITQIALTK